MALILPVPVRDEVLDAPDRVRCVGEAEADRRQDGVNAVATRFARDVTLIVNHVSVITQAAIHLVGAAAAINPIVARAAVQRIRTISAKDLIIATQRVDHVVASHSVDRVAPVCWSKLTRYGVVRVDRIVALSARDLDGRWI